MEVRPGIVSKTSDGKIQCKPIYSRIVSLFAEQNELQYAVPGGLIGQPLPSFLLLPFNQKVLCLQVLVQRLILLCVELIVWLGRLVAIAWG